MGRCFAFGFMGHSVLFLEFVELPIFGVVFLFNAVVVLLVHVSGGLRVGCLRCRVDIGEIGVFGVGEELQLRGVVMEFLELLAFFGERDLEGSEFLFQLLVFRDGFLDGLLELSELLLSFPNFVLFLLQIATELVALLNELLLLLLSLLEFCLELFDLTVFLYSLFFRNLLVFDCFL
jgi:hypothetical protein